MLSTREKECFAFCANKVDTLPSPPQVCDGDGTTCLGCDMAADSGKKTDECGVCDGDGSSCKGCDGVAKSGKKLDSCGVCGGTVSTCGGTYVPGGVPGGGSNSQTGNGGADGSGYTIGTTKGGTS